MDANKNKKNSSSYPRKSGWWSVVFWVMLVLGTYYLFEGAIQYNLNPNKKVQTHTSIEGSQQKKVIILKRNIYHSYLVSGTLKQQPVTFLIDTGATHVTVPSHVANKLNLPYGRKAKAHTANGEVTIYKTVIPEITIGDITLKNIPGNISPGLEMDEVLLGMSALKHLTIVQQNDKMFLIHYSNQPKGSSLIS